MRDRLIEVIKGSLMENISKSCMLADNIADIILADGWMRPPCKVGDKVYYITGIHGKIIKEAIVTEIYYNGDAYAFQLNSDYAYFTLQHNEVYFSREEAVEALKGGASDA